MKLRMAKSASYNISEGDVIKLFKTVKEESVSVKILENLRKAVLEYDNEQAASLARKISKKGG